MKKAFTLSEVIIVMGVIGIVAAVTIPTLMSNVNQNVFTQQQDLAIKKIRAATDQMRTDDLITAYSTNDLFADQFQKYIKTAKRCNSGNLQQCFSSTFITSSGDIVNLTDLVKGTDIGNNNGTNLVGLQLINGTTMLLAFKSDCQSVNPYNDTIDTTTCMSIVYDVNGFGKPNQIGKDISLLNATITTCAGTKIGGLCVAPSDVTYTPINDLLVGDEESGYWYVADYWSGASKACNDLGMRLPSTSELNTIWQNRATIGGFAASSYYWSSTESDPSNAWYKIFDAGGYQSSFSKGANCKARCVK